MEKIGIGQPFSAEFYNGISSVPANGTAVIEQTTIRFTENSGENELMVHIAYADILEIITRENQTRLIIKGETSVSPSLLLVIHALGISRIIKTHVVKNTESSTAGRLNKFRWMPLRKKLFWLFVAVFIMIVSYLWCIHRVYHFVPISTDIFIGNKIAGLLMKNNKICDNPEVKDRMDSILAAFAPSDSGFKYDITVINKNEVNAFALPGGKIFVFSGLLANTESSEEIAGVIAHEIAHIEKRHGVQNLIRAIGIHYIISMALGVGFEDFDTIDTLSEFSDLLIILKYSRGFEYEADVYGADILHRSGLSVAGLKSFMIKSQKNRPDSETIEPGENRLVDFLSTHPAVPRRIELLNQVLEKETVDYSDLFEKDVDWKNLSASCETPE